MAIKGIILNTEAEFNTLNDSIHNWCLANLNKYKASKWTNPIIGKDSTYLLIVDEVRLSGYDFTGYTIEDIDKENINYFFNND